MPDAEATGKQKAQFDAWLKEHNAKLAARQILGGITTSTYVVGGEPLVIWKDYRPGYEPKIGGRTPESAYQYNMHLSNGQAEELSANGMVNIIPEEEVSTEVERLRVWQDDNGVMHMRGDEEEQQQLSEYAALARQRLGIDNNNAQAEHEAESARYRKAVKKQLDTLGFIMDVDISQI